MRWPSCGCWRSTIGGTDSKVSEQRVEVNKAVHFTYFISDDTGNRVEHSDIPVGYIHGANSPILPRLGEVLSGRSVGDQVEVTVGPEEGFGPHRPELTFIDDLKNVPSEFRQIGAEVEMKNDRGESKKFVVSKIEGDKLTVDGNHPLAGKTITFHLTITEIRDASNEEIASGQLSEGPFGLLQ